MLWVEWFISDYLPYRYFCVPSPCLLNIPKFRVRKLQSARHVFGVFLWNCNFGGSQSKSYIIILVIQDRIPVCFIAAGCEEESISVACADM
jgi:hypothetical protein